MKANLFINYYVDAKPRRQTELDYCLVENLCNPELDLVVVLANGKDAKRLDHLKSEFGYANWSRLHTVVMEGRPTYRDYFRLTREHGGDVNAVANSDIVLDAGSMVLLKGWNWRNYCLALSRWDYRDGCLMDPVPCSNQHSQDAWIVRGGFPDVKADFYMGKMRCDNRIAFLLSKQYDVINPCHEVKCYHYHLCEVRHYVMGGDDVPGEVLYVPPCPLPR